MTSQVAAGNGAAVLADDSLEGALSTLHAARKGRLPVIDRDRYVGSICRAEIAHYDEIVRELGTERLNLEISPRDEMLGHARTVYLSTGMSGLRAIRRALALTKLAPRTVLDFACGHGRVLRFLVAAFPSARITASDLDPDAVEFCRKAFGVNGFRSSEEPAEIECGERFDLIWCGSLLTHLDAERWRGFLALFRSLLEPGGMLVFTTHGRHATEELRRQKAMPPNAFGAYDATGFGYADHPGASGYGGSISTPEWVDRTVAGQGLRVVDHAERGWADFQDVVSCVKA